MPIQTLCILRTWCRLEGGGRWVQQPSEQAVKKWLHECLWTSGNQLHFLASVASLHLIHLCLTRRSVCCSKVAKGRGFTFPIIFHDHWQSLCLFIDLWLFLSTYISQSVLITLSRFWANTFTLFKTQIPSMENMLQLFLDSLIQFQSVILNIIRICLSVSAHFSLWGLLHLWSDSADPGLHSGEAVLHKTQCCLNLLMLWCWSWNWAGDLCFVLTLPRQGFTLQCLIDSE